MGITEPPSGTDIRVLVNGFEQPLPAVEVIWYLGAQVDQDLGGQVRVDSGGAAMLERLLQRYLGGIDSTLAQWLLSRSEGELLITLTPRRLFSWDYRQRMAEASS